MEGELARARLNQVGIRSSLESAELLTWLWHCTYAFRGAALRVCSTDRDRALEVLNAGDGEGIASRACVACGETLPSDWVVCWRCGTDADGNRDDKFFVDLFRHTALLAYLKGIQFFLLLLVLLAVLFALMPQVALLLALVLPMYAYPAHRERSTTAWEPEQDAALPEVTTVADEGDELCRRAMASAMFGFVWFPPLTLYSLWLLNVAWEIPASSKGRRRRRAAWILNVCSLITLGTVILFMLSDFQNSSLWSVFYDSILICANLAIGSPDRVIW
jgi:hypothetical protein